MIKIFLYFYLFFIYAPRRLHAFTDCMAFTGEIYLILQIWPGSRIQYPIRVIVDPLITDGKMNRVCSCHTWWNAQFPSVTSEPNLFKGYGKETEPEVKSCSSTDWLPKWGIKGQIRVRPLASYTNSIWCQCITNILWILEWLRKIIIRSSENYFCDSSETRKNSTEMSLPYVIVSGIYAIIVTSINICCLLVIWRSRKLHSPPHITIFSLLLGHLLQGILTIPWYAVKKMSVLPNTTVDCDIFRLV